MKAAAPYRPRVRRDPAVSRLLWEGVYHALVVGLLAGLGLWAFFLLGGAPLIQDRWRAVLTLTAWGVFAAAAVCAWVWGSRGLPAVGAELEAEVGMQLEWLVRPFVGRDDAYDRERRVQAAARRVARSLLAAPVGVPVMVAAASGGKLRPVGPGPLAVMALLGALMWVLLAGTIWQWTLARPEAAPAPPRPVAVRAAVSRRDANLDSSLQLAVARAKRAKAEGDLAGATQILEEALRQAQAQGRSVAHLQLHWHLAWLYADQGNRDGAIVMFQTVLDLAQPGSHEYEEAAAALGRLRRATEDAGAPTDEGTPLLQEDAEPPR